MAPEPATETLVKPLVERVERIHAKAKAAGKVRPPDPPKEPLPLDGWADRPDLR